MKRILFLPLSFSLFTAAHVFAEDSSERREGGLYINNEIREDTVWTAGRIGWIEDLMFNKGERVSENKEILTPGACGFGEWEWFMVS